MKASISSVTFELTPDEVTILRTIFQNILDDDPYGAASKDLQCSVEIVVDVAREFQAFLDKAKF